MSETLPLVSVVSSIAQNALTTKGAKTVKTAKA